MSSYEVETPRLWLEHLATKHLQDFHELWSSKETMIWSPRNPFQTVTESEIWLQQCLTSTHPEIDKYAILLRPTNPYSQNAPKMIGVVGTKSGGEEIAYMLHYKYWGKGYMSEAIIAFAGKDGVFWSLPERKNILRLRAQIVSDNVASEKLIQKIGGKLEKLEKKGFGLARDKGADGIVPEDKFLDLGWWYVDRPEGR